MLRFSILVLMAVSSCHAFAPSAALPSLRRSAASSPQLISMKAEKTPEEKSLTSRRIVIGGILALLAPVAGLPMEADARGSGGRMGGGSFSRGGGARMGGGAGIRGRVPTAPPRTIIQRPSVTVIQSAPSYGYGGGGFGYGGGMGMGYGMSPGWYLGLSAIQVAEEFQRENRRREYIERELKQQQQIGKDSAQIEALTKQLAENTAKMADLEKAKATAK